jgi:lysozyme
MLGLNAVIDLSHHNANPRFQDIRTFGILAVLHKATQGTGGTDSQYEGRRQPAMDAGLLWGAYHFGTGDPGGDQAAHFLAVTQAATRPSDLLVLDLEPNPAGTTMAIADAEAFVQAVHDATGRWPGLYSGNLIKEQFPGSPDSPLTRCWLWLAQYGPLARVPKGWKDWTLWQYTDGAVGPVHEPVAGVGPCDRETFNGDEAALRAFWASGIPPVA